MGSGEQKDRMIMIVNRQPLLLLLALIAAFGCNAERKSSFAFRENEQGVELQESGKPVFFYQRTPKSLTGQYVCNNYLHPLYSIAGDTLTQEFPADHPYHRGIFWAWHQLYIGKTKAGDGWMMDSITQDVANVRSGVKKSLARIALDVFWKSSVWQNGKPFVHEHTTITVHPLHADMRIIDFEISLRALVQEVSIGGSDDEKGYGGFCTRIRMPSDLVFTSAKGPVVPQNLQIEAGPWMDFSATFGKNGQKSGIAILCHPETPNYPAPWILRQVTSMQNVVFPGRKKIALSADEPVILKYRLIVHNGGPGEVNISQQNEDYSR
jgi:hypothetical protein